MARWVNESVSSAPAPARFSRALSPRDELHSLLDAFEICAANPAEPGPDAAIHGVRVRSKQLRALLDLVRPAIRFSLYRSERRLVRSAARRLSQTRDQTVLREEIIRCARSLHGKKRRRTQRFLDETQREFRTPSALSRAERSVAELDRALDRLRHAQPRPLRLEEGLKRSYARARHGMRASRKDHSAECFHYWRKWAKRLELQLDLLRAAAVSREGAIGHSLATLQKRLGCHRDLLLAERFLSSRRAPRCLLRVVRQTRHGLEKKVLRSGRKLFRSKPRHFIAQFQKNGRSFLQSKIR